MKTNLVIQTDLSTLIPLIQSSYYPVPYHGWPHGKYVANNVERILWMKHKRLTFSSYMHDAGHMYHSTPDDEKISVELATAILKSRNESQQIIQRVELDIYWTIFKNRWELNDHDQMILADADIANIWDDYETFIRHSVKYFLETKSRHEFINKKDFFNIIKNTNLWFSKVLTTITWNDNNPFLTHEAQKAFPNFASNREKLIDALENNQDFLLKILQEEWKLFFKSELIFL